MSSGGGGWQFELPMGMFHTSKPGIYTARSLWDPVLQCYDEAQKAQAVSIFYKTNTNFYRDYRKPQSAQKMNLLIP
jgi:hypothetical protein